MGWFEHGSTIVVLAPSGFLIADGITEGTIMRMGQPLMYLPNSAPHVCGVSQKL
jgi:phosphatidylserine decarboxylase